MWRAFALTCLLAACSQAASSPVSPSESADARPMRIVSLDLCADQYVLKYADRDRILAVSPEADLEISYMREAAKGISQVRPLAENILLLKPDLIVRAYGGGPNAEHFFERAGIPVLNVGWASDVEDIKQVVLNIAAGLGAPQAGLETVTDIENRLAAIIPPAKPVSALYMTASGYSTGSDTLIDDFFLLAGLENYSRKSGWHALPLEDLAQSAPDLIALAYHESLGSQVDTWSGTRNPIARNLLRDKPVVKLDGAIMSCSGWYVIDAIEALAKGAQE